MWLRLRQIAGVAAELNPVEDELIDVLGIEVCYRDPNIDYFGLENALFPIGNQLLEVVAPIQDNTAGGRYLQRRGGDGGYMVITQCDDHPPRRQRVTQLGIRIVHDASSDQFINMQLHPRDTGGTFFEIDQQLGEGALDPDGPWHPAGTDWKAGQRLDRVTGISAAEVQCDDPEDVARRWSEVAETDLEISDGAFLLALENAVVRFVKCTDGRPEGLGGIDLEVADRDGILEAAEKRGRISGDNQVYLCGMRMNV